MDLLGDVPGAGGEILGRDLVIEEGLQLAWHAWQHEQVAGFVAVAADGAPQPRRHPDGVVEDELPLPSLLQQPTRHITVRSFYPHPSTTPHTPIHTTTTHDPTSH